MYHHKDHQVFIISLPRTGTTSMCKMLNVLGYKSKHVPSCFYEKWAKEGFNAFGDTPCFAPTFVKAQSIMNPKNKFIFIDKPVAEWCQSFESVKLHQSYNILMNIFDPKELNVVKLNEILAYGEVFGFKGVYDPIDFMNAAERHRKEIINILPYHQLLIYDFNMGWEPLCEFLDAPMPAEDVPVLNRRGKINENYEHNTSN